MPNPQKDKKADGITVNSAENRSDLGSSPDAEEGLIRDNRDDLNEALDTPSPKDPPRGKLIGEQFLHQKDSGLHISAPVAREADRNKRAGRKVLQKPADKIADWLRVIERTHTEHGDDPKVLERIREYYRKEYSMKPEDIPESAYLLEQRIAREEGHGDIEITDEFRERKTRQIITDQKASLDRWVNYLSSKDASYPMWAKYWAFSSMLKMGKFEKTEKEERDKKTESGRFVNRTKDTIAAFPTLNPRALAMTVGAIQSKLEEDKKPKNERKPVENLSVKLDDPDFQKLLTTENFSKLYAQFLIEMPEYSTKGLQETRGKWVKYLQDSDPKPLVDSLEGYPLEWCTANIDTARTQLQGGDFWVYYSINEAGEAVIPRLAIRMQDGKIAEPPRGIAHNQNLDPYIGEVLETKLNDFPDKEQFKKKSADMKRLTAIEKKHEQNEKLTPEELRFLYETNGKIEGFGYGDDPRIEEIKQERNIKADYAVIYGIREDQVTDDLKDFSPETRVYIGKEKTYRFGRNASQKEVEAFSGIIAPFGLVCDMTEVSQPIKDNITKWEGDLKDSGKDAVYPNLRSIGGVLDIQNPEKLRIIDIIGNRLKETPKHYKRPKEFDIAKVTAALNANPAAIASLQKMEATGGMVDIIADEGDAFVFADCSAESPAGRRDLNFDQSAQMAEAFGVKLMDGDTYWKIQETGNFDLNNWSWLETDVETRKTGHAWRGDRGTGGVRVDQSYAGNHYPHRGWRGLLRVQKT